MADIVVPILIILGGSVAIAGPVAGIIHCVKKQRRKAKIHDEAYDSDQLPDISITEQAQFHEGISPEAQKMIEGYRAFVEREKLRVEISTIPEEEELSAENVGPAKIYISGEEDSTVLTDSQGWYSTYHLIPPVSPKMYRPMPTVGRCGEDLHDIRAKYMGDSINIVFSESSKWRAQIGSSLEPSSVGRVK